MLFRKTIFALALAGAALPAAFANTGYTFVGGEDSFMSHAMPIIKSRADVQKEFLAFRQNPVTADGVTLVGGEESVIFAKHSFGFQGGKLVHTDRIAHDTQKSSPIMTLAERREYQELYGNGV